MDSVVHSAWDSIVVSFEESALRRFAAFSTASAFSDDDESVISDVQSADISDDAQCGYQCGHRYRQYLNH